MYRHLAPSLHRVSQRSEEPPPRGIEWTSACLFVTIAKSRQPANVPPTPVPRRPCQAAPHWLWNAPSFVSERATSPTTVSAWSFGRPAPGIPRDVPQSHSQELGQPCPQHPRQSKLRSVHVRGVQRGKVSEPRKPTQSQEEKKKKSFITIQRDGLEDLPCARAGPFGAHGSSIPLVLLLGKTHE